MIFFSLHVPTPTLSRAQRVKRKTGLIHRLLVKKVFVEEEMLQMGKQLVNLGGRVALQSCEDADFGKNHTFTGEKRNFIAVLVFLSCERNSK